MGNQRPTPIAVAVVRKGDTVLIGLRPDDVPLAGYWEFPGGKIQPRESAADAAVRECLEETGIRIQVSGTCAVVEHHYDHGPVRIHFFEASALEPEALPEAPFRWVPIAQLDEHRFPPANAAVLKLLMKG